MIINLESGMAQSIAGDSGFMTEVEDTSGFITEIEDTSGFVTVLNLITEIELEETQQ